MSSEAPLPSVADIASSSHWALRGKLVTGVAGEAVVEDGVVVVEGTRITWCGSATEAPPEARDAALPVPVVLPGLVDVHCHGGAGATFSADASGNLQAARHHARHGSTSVLASLVSAPTDVLLEQILVLRDLVHRGEIAGLHLEGPFIVAAMCGAQDPQAIIPGDPVLLERWLHAGQGTVRSMTVAPETAHFADLVAVCRRYGVVPSLGHTAASAQQTRDALASDSQHGPFTATHLFNRMPAVGHRIPGPVPVLLETARTDPESMVLELIADDVHLAPDIVRMVFALVGPGATALITDAMAAAGVADGHYTLGALRVEVNGGVARLEPSQPGSTDGAIAGGTSRLIEGVRNCVAWGIPLADAVAAASRTPARAVGLEDVGFLGAGARADLIIAAPDLTINTVVRGGSPVTS